MIQSPFLLELYILVVVTQFSIFSVSLGAALRLWQINRTTHGSVHYLGLLLGGMALGHAVMTVGWLAAMFLMQHGLTWVWLVALIAGRLLEGGSVVLFSMYLIGVFDFHVQPRNGDVLSEAAKRVLARKQEHDRQKEQEEHHESD